MKKKFVSVILAASMVLGMSACGTSGGGDKEGADASGTSDGNVVNIYFASDIEEMLSGTIEAYKEENPDAEIVVHSIPNDDYDDKIKILLSGGAEDVDVFYSRSPAFVNQYRSVGAIEDISPYAEKSGVDLSPVKEPVDAVSDGDQFYGLPIYSGCWMLFYNKELFKEAGVECPTEQLTWEEYCELAESLTKKEGDTQYWGGMCPIWTMNLGAIAAGEYLTDDAPLEKTREYLEITKRMYDKSHMPVEEMNSGSWDINASFAAGNIYMMINGDWEYSLLECDFEYGSAPLPILDGVDEKTSMGNSAYICMAKTAKNKQAAYDFMEFFTTSDAGTSAIAKTGNVPSYATDAAMAVYQESVQVEGVDTRFEMSILPEQANDMNYSAVNDAFSQEAQLYLLGEESLDECMDKFYELREETE